MGCCCGGVLGDIPVELDLCIYRGDTFTLDLFMVDDAGNPVDISGRTYTGGIRPSLQSATFTPFTVSVSLPDSLVSLSLTDVQTADQAAVPRRGVWDVQELVIATGDITTLLRGSVSASLGVTP